MKKAFLAMLALLVAGHALADDYVNGYYRRDGTYVAPHYKTEPNRHRFDNYSSQGNVNPYTGQSGHQRHEYSNPPAYNNYYGNPSYGNSRRHYDPFQLR